MDNIPLKVKQVFRAMGISLLIGSSVVSWLYEGTRQERIKSQFTNHSEIEDTIITVAERSRVRVLLDVVKKMALMVSNLSNLRIDFQVINSSDLKALFINSYQRNVYYVYASHSVP